MSNIEARKGYKVIAKHQYTLQSKTSQTKLEKHKQLLIVVVIRFNLLPIMPMTS